VGSKDVEGAGYAPVVGADKTQQEVLAIADYHCPHVNWTGARLRAEFRARSISLSSVLNSSGELL
jgi:hypothetical protein